MLPDPLEEQLDLPSALLPLEVHVAAVHHGWYFVHAVAMVFDRQLRADKTRERFSRII